MRVGAEGASIGASGRVHGRIVGMGNGQGLDHGRNRSGVRTGQMLGGTRALPFVDGTQSPSTPKAQWQIQRLLDFRDSVWHPIPSFLSLRQTF